MHEEVVEILTSKEKGDVDGKMKNPEVGLSMCSAHLLLRAAVCNSTSEHVKQVTAELFMNDEVREARLLDPNLSWRSSQSFSFGHFSFSLQGNKMM